MTLFKAARAFFQKKVRLCKESLAYLTEPLKTEKNAHKNKTLLTLEMEV